MERIKTLLEALCEEGNETGRFPDITEALVTEGQNIDFKYKGRMFQWYGVPKENESDVYLMTMSDEEKQKSENSEYMRRPHTDINANDEKKYYCFKVEAEDTVESFKNKMQKIITEATRDRQLIAQ